MHAIRPPDDRWRRRVPPLGTFPTADEISTRAHALFVRGGRSRPVAECWRAAEQELLERAACRIGRVITFQR
jgi:hypothetical protein